MEITPQQHHFFETFGYLALPGLLVDDIGWIAEEFAAVWEDRGVVHDGTKRSCIVPFIDQRERLCTLIDHPHIEALIAGLLGDDFNYLGGDGNFYTGDTGWHSDGAHRVGQYLKIALYLDPVARDTGCLRVIPGSHRLEGAGARSAGPVPGRGAGPGQHAPESGWAARQAGKSRELWGIEPRDVPCVALETQPGDVVAFNHNLMHASFGGSQRRRMFTLNNCRRCETPEEIQELEKYISARARFWTDHMHSDVMKATASPQRMRHLRQVMEHEGHLPALVAKARQEMPEPALG
jgi:hypothetical protein